MYSASELGIIISTSGSILDNAFFAFSICLPSLDICSAVFLFTVVPLFLNASLNLETPSDSFSADSFVVDSFDLSFVSAIGSLFGSIPTTVFIFLGVAFNPVNCSNFISKSVSCVDVFASFSAVELGYCFINSTTWSDEILWLVSTGNSPGNDKTSEYPSSILTPPLASVAIQALETPLSLGDKPVTLFQLLAVNFIAGLLVFWLTNPPSSPPTSLDSWVFSSSFLNWSMVSETSFILLEFSEIWPTTCSGVDPSDISALAPSLTSTTFVRIKSCALAGTLSTFLPVFLLTTVGFPFLSTSTSIVLLPGTWYFSLFTLIPSSVEVGSVNCSTSPSVVLSLGLSVCVSPSWICVSVVTCSTSPSPTCCNSTSESFPPSVLVGASGSTCSFVLGFEMASSFCLVNCSALSATWFKVGSSIPSSFKEATASLTKSGPFVGVKPCLSLLSLSCSLSMFSSVSATLAIPLSFASSFFSLRDSKASSLVTVISTVPSFSLFIIAFACSLSFL